MYYEEATKPFVTSNVLDWQILNWGLDKWGEVIGSDELTFRKGDAVSNSTEPQWERRTEILKKTFADFTDFIKTDGCRENWLYFDYKYLKEWFRGKAELQTAISWGIFGFPDKTAEDSTIWIGSKGAHTPCHIDTYGFNLVAQVYGRKLWLLWPPEENLLPTRIPYEESSVYSKINFYSPDMKIVKGLSNCRSVILEPGQVLFVPNGWWHYVENLETAISVNAWIPLGSDDEKRINEAITLTMVKGFIAGADDEEKKAILNPNENLDATSLPNCIDLIKNLLENKTKNRSSEKKLHEITVNKANIKEVEKLSDEDFRKLMTVHSKRYIETESKALKEAARENKGDLTRLLEALTDGDVIELIKHKLVCKFE